ncbi:MAG: MFS transporter [Mariprofundaceae bacterium]|nr:MFS transporter [Mariprofundaceae bacterium]
MNSLERRGTFSLAGIYALRMLGLFMILPVFSLYAESLEGHTPTLIGLALGIYGLTMALFQIPFGMLSDRFGRKPVIMVGLLLFTVGSVIAATSDSIVGVIIGRAIQGAGAIAAAMMALLADLTREEHRTKAMAFMGISIGISFTLALVLGPFLNNVFGVAGIFWLTAVLAIAGIGVLYLIVPDPDPGQCHVHRDAETVPAQLKQVIFDGQLLRLDLGIMIQHGIMMAMFTALPFVLRDFLNLPSREHAWFYLPVLVLSAFGMVPLIIIAEKKQKMKQVFLLCVSFMAVAECMLGLYHESLFAVAAGLLFFFIAFNTLEASLPSLISRMAPVDGKGTAMGVYSTSQFFGAFVGGAFGGYAYGALGVQGVFYACAAAAFLWIAIAAGMRVPGYLSSYMVHVDLSLHGNSAALTDRLLAVAGVHEAKVVAEDGTAYLRIDRQKFNPDDVNRLLAAD